MDLDDLFGLVRRLDPRRRREPPPVALEVPAVRPRIATPPAVVPPLVTATGPAVTLAPDLGLVGEAPPMPRPTIGLIGGDVDPRIADPLEYRRNRVAEMSVEPPRKMGRWEGFKKGALRGFAAGGLGGLAFGAGMGAGDPGSVARMEHDDELGRERQRYADLYQMSKAQTDLEGAQLSNDVRAAQIPYLLARPGLEDRKLDLRGAYDAWRMKSGDRKADTAEEYIAWRMANGDRRAETAEGQLELRREYVREIQPRQFDRRMDETERHNVVNESLGGERIRQGDERIDISRQGLTLRERIASGNLDATWARIGQGYDRMDEGRRRQVDALATKAATAEAEAAYFEGSGKAAEAKLRREQASALRRQAEGIAAAPAPRVARPWAPPAAAPGGWGEDPDVRAYADQFFGGDYGKAQMTIEEQRKRRR